MNASQYQKLAARTLIDRPDFAIDDTNMMILWNALGLAGEAGEVAEMVKKGILHQHGLFYEKMAKELGDVLWYVAALCTKLDLDMGDVMTANIEKLKVRYPDGFKSEDSVARVDTRPLWPPDWDTIHSSYQWSCISGDGRVWIGQSLDTPETSGEGWWAIGGNWFCLGQLPEPVDSWRESLTKRPEVQA